MARAGSFTTAGQWLLVATVLLTGSAAWADDEASAAYSRGMNLLGQGQQIEARSQLSAALFSGKLSATQEAAAVKSLTTLAKETIFSSKIVEGDPVAYSYTVQSGQTLANIARSQGCNVPLEVIEQINDIKPTSIRAGQTIKLLRGPFCAQINKRSFTLDVYLQANGQKVFVRRVKVALGKNDATPEGLFRVAAKAKHATWTPPKSMAKKYPRPIEWGQKGYPLGKDGYFMSLRGLEASTRNVKGYGIHGTNDQSSIGKPRSHGCVRVGDKDIGQVFAMMTEGASTVQITR